QLLLGSGLALAVLTGAASWLGGRQFLESAKVKLDVPLLGTVEAGSTLAFDIGVYLVVVGLVLALLRTLGSEAGP
ncbi:MAG TPA: MnhB domain-containing protein, partial [Acidimicrobiales bacterium]|nr:MnhB domain-containing protein [Acidimicrobiales bacterium]